MTEPDQLVLSSIRGGVGDWAYYIASMKMKDIAQRVKRAQTFYSSDRLEEQLQRTLEPSRVKKIKDYLLAHDQRFFNSIVIGTYGGNPQWDPIDIEPVNPALYTIPEGFSGSLGLLILDGSEQMFAIDGQHRVEGIRLAVDENPSLGDEEVGVIFVRGVMGDHRDDDPGGYIRTRRLFTTLNKYGKKVSKKDIIALDEDDVIAIITRRHIEEHDLFTGNKTSIKASTSIPTNDLDCFTSINALYDCLNIYLKRGTSSEWAKYKTVYPGIEAANRYYDESVTLWDSFCHHSAELNAFKNDTSEFNKAENYRNENGGHLFFRPIGLLIAISVVRHLKEQHELSIDEAVERLMLAETNIAEPPWVHLIWNPLNQKILTASANRKAAEKILSYSLGVSLERYNTNEDELRGEIAAIQNRDVSEILLPSYIE